MTTTRCSRVLVSLIVVLLASFALTMSAAPNALAADGASFTSPANGAKFEVGKSVELKAISPYVKPEGTSFVLIPKPNYVYFKVTKDGERVAYTDEGKEHSQLAASLGVSVSYSFDPKTEGEYCIEVCRDATYVDNNHVELAYDDFVADETRTIIVQRSIKNAQVSGIVSKTYTGQELTQAPTVVIAGNDNTDKTLDPATDYDVTYTNNTDVGEATVTITGKGFYKDTVTAKFNITPADISQAAMTGAAGKTYTGSAITQNPVVTWNNRTLVAGTDYDIAYANNTNAGTATVTANGRGNFTGSLPKTFAIGPASIRAAGEPTLVDKTYTGSAITQNLSFSYNGTPLVAGQDYTVAYANNVNPGTATVTITGKGNFKDTITRTFSILEASSGQTEGDTTILSPEDGTRVETGTPITLRVRANKYEEAVTPTGTVMTGMGNFIFVRITKDGNSFDYNYGKVTSKGGVIGGNITFNQAGVYKFETCWTTYTYTVNGTSLTFAPLPEEQFVADDSVTVYVGVPVPGNDKDVANATVTGFVESKEYTGNSITQSPTVKLGGKTLKNGTDYYITYASETYNNSANNVDIGIVKMTIHGKGAYTGTWSRTFLITPKKIAASMITLTPSSFVYTGELQKPQVTVTAGSTVLKESVDYTLTNAGGTEPGQYQVSVKGKGNYSPETVTKNYTIGKWPLKNAVVTCDPKTYVYDGTAKTPAVTATLNGAVVPPQDYDVTYSKNTAAGTATATITAKANSYYTGSASGTFTIGQVSITASEISVAPIAGATFNRKAQTPVPQVTFGEAKLKNGTDFTLTYQANTNVGTAKVTITGKGNFKGSRTETFTIAAKDINASSITVGPVDRQRYADGKPLTPKITVRDGKDVLTSSEYAVAYADNTQVGTASATITGKGNYTGTRSVVKFEIYSQVEYDKMALSDKIAEIEGAGIGAYLPADQAAIKAAIEKAKAILANANVTEADVKTVSDALNKAIGVAKDNLAKAKAAEAQKQKEEQAAYERAKKEAQALPTPAAVEKSILGQKTDKDPKGSKFAPLKAKSVKQTKGKNVLKWSKVAGASSYVVYGSKCGKSNKIKKLATVKKTSYTHKKLAKGTYYKYVVVAVKDTVIGQRVVSVSKTVHVATKGGKVGNFKVVKLNKKAKVLKKGAKLKLKAKLVAASKTLKVKKHRKVCFASSNAKVASVSKTGVVTAKGTGTCVIYAYAQNGVFAKCKVTVK